VKLGKWLSVKTLVFLVILYAGFWLGNMVVGYLEPMWPSLFSGVYGSLISFIIPGFIAYIGWVQFGKGK
jgi:hypothetical protein